MAFDRPLADRSAMAPCWGNPRCNGQGDCTSRAHTPLGQFLDPNAPWLDAFFLFVPSLGPDFGGIPTPAALHSTGKRTPSVKSKELYAKVRREKTPVEEASTDYN